MCIKNSPEWECHGCGSRFLSKRYCCWGRVCLPPGRITHSFRELLCLCSWGSLIQTELGIKALVWLHRTDSSAVWVSCVALSGTTCSSGECCHGMDSGHQPSPSGKVIPSSWSELLQTLKTQRGSEGTQVLWTRVPLTFHERLLLSPRYLVVLRAPSFNKSTLACF